MGEELALTGPLNKAASEFPGRIAVSACREFDLTHARLQELVDHAAVLLTASGIGAADDVVLAFPNTVEFVILFLAVIRCRATAATLNPIYTVKQFKFYLSNSEPKLLLTPQKGNRRAHSTASKLNIPHMTAKLHSTGSRITLSSTDVEPSLDLMSKVVNDPSDRNLASSVQNIKRVYKLTEPDSTVIVLPLFHVHSLVAGLLSSLASGAAMALPAAVRFSAPTFLADMVSYNATLYTADAMFHQIILDHHLSKLEPTYPKLRFITSCSASLATSIRARLKEAFGATVLEAYAMREATHPMASKPLPEDGEHKPGSVGRPVGREMAILDEHGVIQGAGVSGEVCLRGLKVTECYKNNPEANKTTEENETETERDGKILGKGGFGDVYEGHIRDACTQVAVKIMNSDSHQGIKEYKSEVMTLSQLRHKNLVSLIGYCHEANKFVLVYEFMREGSLGDHLFKGRSSLTWERRYDIALGLASARYYFLEQYDQCVIHKDIKSSNTMIDEKFNTK
ncbi:hypothetical protein EUGRSUZ_E00591 [Eucalyptus grandis]|uniref:Uncharacterized protein n=2 Tax=Eucalyptus grandis TaxID=71139 RepID=A0ACC3KT15_EUCGR|nr:hypothetical protein EUGRSUZ_E00591 [Eucalyptus grandis]